MISKFETYSELYFILEQIPNSYMMLVPRNIITKLKQQMSLEHYNSFNTDEVFYKQNFDTTTIDLLEKIYLKYWNENNKNSEIIKDIYNPENLFKNRRVDLKKDLEETALIEYKDNLFKKIINFINKKFKNKR